MNLLKSKLRRTTALLAGAILGLAGAAVFAAPASAHTPVVTGEASCLSGAGWTVDWAVANDSAFAAKVVKASVADQAGNALTLTGALATAGTVVPVGSDTDATKQVHGSTAISDAAVTAAKISVVLVYATDGGDEQSAPVTVTVTKPTENCATPEPSDSSPSASASATPSTSGSASASVSPSASQTPDVPMPTDLPGDAEQPTPILEFYCDALVFGLDNPAGGIEWQLHFETSAGEERDLTIKPGEKKTEVFDASAGFSVTIWPSIVIDGVTVPVEDENGEEVQVELSWEQPEGCESGSGGGLPVTGAAAGGLAGGAAVLLSIGAVLFVLARRRKLKFTA